jgi:hypothetical protein
MFEVEVDVDVVPTSLLPIHVPPVPPASAG